MISVIIPVYNVEKYLPECLDSVLAQTMRDIQIICVNDGSTDRSPEILEKYAAKDSRIEIIHKENGGLSSARNAAYPFIRGEYTLFIDSDDFIEPTLCEKTIAVALREQADMTFFFYLATKFVGRLQPLVDFLQTRCFSEVGTDTLLKEVAAWNKLWSSRFILNNNLIYPDGLCFEDNVMHWKAMQYSPKVSCVPEYLYHYRTSNSSILSDTRARRNLDLVSCYDLIQKDLIALGNYHGEWKRLFLEMKLRALCSRCNMTSGELRVEMLKRITDSYGEDEKEFMRGKHGFPWYAVDFYRAVEGSKIAACKCVVNAMLANAKHSFQYNIGLLREKFRKSA